MLISLFITALVLCLIVGKVTRNYLSPSAFFFLYWVVIGLSPLIIAPSFYADINAVVWIICFLCSFSFGGMLSKIVMQPRGRNDGIEKVILFGSQRMNILIYFGGISLLAAVLVLLTVYGRSIGSILTQSAIQELSRESALLRYHTDFKPPVLVSLLTSFGYLSMILLGAKYAATGKASYGQIGFLCFSIFLLATVLNTKATILYALILWVSSFWSMSLLVRKGGFQLFKWRAIAYSSLAGVALISIFSWMQLARYQFRVDLKFVLLEKLYMYAFGHLGGFSIWLERFNYFSSEDLGYGKNTLGGVFNLFLDDVQGSKILMLPKDLGGGLITNVDTIFSDVIMDFGVSGAMFFAFIMGFLCERSFNAVSRGRVAHVVPLGMFYSLVLWSFVTSILNYTSIIMAWVMYFGVIMYFFSLNRTRLLSES